MILTACCLRRVKTGNVCCREVEGRPAAIAEARRHPYRGPAAEALRTTGVALDSACRADDDGPLVRALANAAQANLKCRRPHVALMFAAAAARCQLAADVPAAAGTLRGKALHRAGVACAALQQPQAALHFLGQARLSAAIHRCAASRIGGAEITRVARGAD